MHEQAIEFKRDGLTLRGALDFPDAQQAKYDFVILMHGFTGNMGRTHADLLYELSEKLTAKGLATLRFDFDGHGHSDGQFEDMTVPSEIADAKAALLYVRHLANVGQISLLGHSQGGVVASMLAGLYPDWIAKVVLMAPAATLKSDAQKGVLQGSHYDPHSIPDALPLSWYPEKVGGFYLRTAQVLPIYAVAQRFTGPVCLIHGTADQTVAHEASQKYQAVYQASELHLIPGADHRFTGASRETATNLAVAFLTK
ncbi:esterase [Lactobacillus selangorensis]|uniref:Esterase n=1 Tax=Lactobacillus selangorensis TaxID=81857 RepID=A0A0R2FHP0_9LACO|nr:alpha/beta fold hydrolase [Lactobacillus selangorensis]KRN28104.1 esterase [Lactobacillus selangorensis]KRN31019.1 esterase [Lactobacillus selangorensis]